MSLNENSLNRSIFEDDRSIFEDDCISSYRGYGKSLATSTSSGKTLYSSVQGYYRNRKIWLEFSTGQFLEFSEAWIAD